MKKLVSFLAVLCMCLSVSACGVVVNRPADTDTTTATETVSDTEKDTEKDTDTGSDTESDTNSETSSDTTSTSGGLHNGGAYEGSGSY